MHGSLLDMDNYPYLIYYVLPLLFYFHDTFYYVLLLYQYFFIIYITFVLEFTNHISTYRFIRFPGDPRGLSWGSPGPPGAVLN